MCTSRCRHLLEVYAKYCAPAKFTFASLLLHMYSCKHRPPKLCQFRLSSSQRRDQCRYPAVADWESTVAGLAKFNAGTTIKWKTWLRMTLCTCAATTHCLEGQHCLTRPVCCRLVDKVDDVSTRTQGIEDRLSRALQSEPTSCFDEGPAKVGARPSDRASLQRLPGTAAHPQTETPVGRSGSGCSHDLDAQPSKPLSAGEVAAPSALPESSAYTQQLSGLAASSALSSQGLPSACYGPIAGKSGLLQRPSEVWYPTVQTGGGFCDGVPARSAVMTSGHGITAPGTTHESAEGRSQSSSSGAASTTSQAAGERDASDEFFWLHNFEVVQPAQLDQFLQNEPRLWKVLKASTFYSDLVLYCMLHKPLPFRSWLRMQLQLPSTMSTVEVHNLLEEEDTAIAVSAVRSWSLLTLLRIKLYGPRSYRPRVCTTDPSSVALSCHVKPSRRCTTSGGTLVPKLDSSCIRSGCTRLLSCPSKETCAGAAYSEVSGACSWSCLWTTGGSQCLC
jgi:hypothetical protein